MMETLCPKQINPQWILKMQRVFNPCPYFELQQMSLIDLSWGASTVAIDLANRHLQPFGVVAGGVYASLIDAAGFWAVYSQVAPGDGMTTVDLKLNFLSPAASGVLIGTGRIVKLGRSLGLGAAEVRNPEGRVLAYGTTTVMVKPNQCSDKVDPSLPKYLP